MKKQASVLVLGVILCLGFFSFWANFIGESVNNANLSSSVEIAEVSNDNILPKSANINSVSTFRSQDPEPATLVLFAVGIVGIVSMRMTRGRS